MSSFARAGVFIFVVSSMVLSAETQAQQGVVEVYVDQHRGNPTASGERYEPAGLTAAHSLLPMGILLRVTIPINGRSVDVRVNDRKAQDGRLVYISGAAGRQLGMAPGQAVQGSIQVLAPHPVQSTGMATPSATAHGAGAEQEFANQKQSGMQKWQGFGLGLFQKNRSSGSLDASRQPGSNPAVAQGDSDGQGFFGRIFGNGSDSAGAASPGRSAKPAYQYPEPAYAPNGQVIPMSSPNPGANHIHAPVAAARPPASAQAVPSSSLPVGPAAPYRVQFGAYKKARHAEQMNTNLLQGGVSTMVVQSTANQLFLVVTQNGFPTAAEAQRWVDFEGARRGWRERPVVIR